MLKGFFYISLLHDSGLLIETAWNSLPPTSTSLSLSKFRSNPKTHIFKLASLLNSLLYPTNLDLILASPSPAFSPIKMIPVWHGVKHKTSEDLFLSLLSLSPLLFLQTEAIVEWWRKLFRTSNPRLGSHIPLLISINALKC